MEDINIIMENANLEIYQLFEPKGLMLFKQAQDARVKNVSEGKDNHFFCLSNFRSGDYVDIEPFGAKRVIIFDVIDTGAKHVVDKQGRINLNKVKNTKARGVIFYFGGVYLFL